MQTVTNNSAAIALLNKIEQKAIQVGVIGLGYVGLPFLLEKARAGLKVIGIDRNAQRVAQVAHGESYINDVSSHELKRVVEQGLVTTSTHFDLIGNIDVIVICVPTPLDKTLCPDLQFVVSVAEEIAQHLRPGQLVCLESTTYPGTTEEVIKPILEKSGLTVGYDFYLAHSPERVDPGNVTFNTKNISKIVGGVDENSLKVAKAFYQLAIETVIPVSSAKAAEMAKVYENTYRAVNIALANEMAMLCDRMDLDVWEVLNAAFTKPFGIMPFYPGPGVGGHCIPVDPHYLEWKAREYNFQTHFVALAGEVNRRMPYFVFDKVTRILNERKKSLSQAKILMLGMSYKKNVGDYRGAPALYIYNLFKKAGCEIRYHDKWVPEFTEGDQSESSVELTDEIIKQSDLVIITTAHHNVDYEKITKLAKVVFDTRNITRNLPSGKIIDTSEVIYL